MIEIKVVIAGCGKVGHTIAKNLTNENVDVTIIDNSDETLERMSDSLDAMFVSGNCLSIDTLSEADVSTADLIISVTDIDETNILCCILAKRLGTAHTIARIRNPDFALDHDRLWKDLGLDMVINPENEAAREISRLLRFPAADDIDIFLGGRVELCSFAADETGNHLIGKTVSEVFFNKRLEILLAVIERDNQAILPRGYDIIEQGDILRILGRPAKIMDFLTKTGKNTERIRSAAIIGGSRIAQYLVSLIHRHSSDMSVTIVDISRKRCEELSEKFSRCIIINGDGADEDIFMSEVAGKTEAIICLTDRDEENAVIASFAGSLGFRKVIVKIDHINKNFVKGLRLGSIVSPKNLTGEHIIRYVRGLMNAAGGEIKTMYNIFAGEEESIEALEFVANKDAKCLNMPIKELKIKKNVLVGCIVRGQSIIIATGDSYIEMDDRVIIVTKNESLTKLDDILITVNENFVLNSRRFV